MQSLITHHTPLPKDYTADQTIFHPALIRQQSLLFFRAAAADGEGFCAAEWSRVESHHSVHRAALPTARTLTAPAPAPGVLREPGRPRAQRCPRPLPPPSPEASPVLPTPEATPGATWIWDSNLYKAYMPADFHYDFYYWIFNPQQILRTVSFILFIAIASMSSAFLSAEASTVSTMSLRTWHLPSCAE